MNPILPAAPRLVLNLVNPRLTKQARNAGALNPEDRVPVATACLVGLEELSPSTGPPRPAEIHPHELPTEDARVLAASAGAQLQKHYVKGGLSSSRLTVPTPAEAIEQADRLLHLAPIAAVVGCGVR